MKSKDDYMGLVYSQLKDKTPVSSSLKNLEHYNEVNFYFLPSNPILQLTELSLGSLNSSFQL